MNMRKLNMKRIEDKTFHKLSFKSNLVNLDITNNKSLDIGLSINNHNIKNIIFNMINKIK